MRKSSPFVAIPTVPTTVSGQWLTYSHMANHYRKLLNVKPRVQSNAPRQPSSSALALQASTMKLVKKLSSATTTGKSKGKQNSETVLRAVRSVPAPVSKVSSFQILFDQTELNNLSEAVMSDTDGEDEPSFHYHNQQMPISEKINLYLDQLQDPLLEDSQSLRSSISHFHAGTKPGATMVRSKVGLGRHSKCFIPHVQGEKPQPKPKLMTKSVLPPKPKKKMAVEKPNAVKPKQPPPAQPIKLSKNEPKASLKSNQSGGKKSERKFSRPNSGSVGSITGSDYLTDKRFLTSLVSESIGPIKSKQRKTKGKSPEFVEEMLLSESNWLPKNTSKLKQNGGQTQSNPVNNLRPKLTSTMSSSLPPGYVNKDSSRDSAYGFSSGESKITTRESTPEKRTTRTNNKKVYMESKSIGLNKYKSNLSTVASSINQENSQADSLQLINSKGNLIPPTIPTIGTTPSNYKMIKQNSSYAVSNDKYINFITAVTEDIIKREVFTNKGLKSLFMAHVELNKDLELERMLGILDKLRMDVGIPKDDALDQMEFGYGSIKYSTTSFFPKYTQPVTELGMRKTVADAEPIGPGSITVGKNPTSDTRPGPASDLSLRQLHSRKERDLNSGDESSRMSSCSVSIADDNVRHFPSNPIGYQNHSEHEEEVPSRDSEGSTPSSKSSGVSLTESEIQRALGQVGFHGESAVQIARITKQGRRKHHQHRHQQIVAELPLEREQNNNKPLVLDGPKIGRFSAKTNSSRTSSSSVENE